MNALTSTIIPVPDCAFTAPASFQNVFLPRLRFHPCTSNLLEELPVRWHACAKPGTPQRRQHKIPEYINLDRDNPFRTHEAQIKQIQLAQKYRKKGQWRVGLSILLAMEEEAGQLTLFLTELIHLESARTFDKFPNVTPLDIFHTLIGFINESNARPDAATFNAVLCSIQKRISGSPNIAQDTLDVAVRVLDQMDRHGIKPDEYTFALVYNLCAITKNTYYLSLFKRRALQTFGHFGNDIAGSSLVGTLTKLGDIDGAEAIAVNLTGRGVKMNDVAYNCLGAAAFRSGRYPLVIKLFLSTFDSPFPPQSPHFYWTLLVSCLKTGDSKNVRLALETMVKQNLPINAKIIDVSFSTAIRCSDLRLGIDLIFLWGNFVDKGHHEKTRFKEENVDIPPSEVPDSKTDSDGRPSIATDYCIRLITVAGRAAKDDNINLRVAFIREILERMENDLKLALGIEVWNAAASALTKLGQFENAKHIIEEEVLGRGLLRNSTSFNVLVRALGGLRCSNEAMAVLDKMRNENIEPDQGTFNSLLQIAKQNGNVRMTENIIAQINRDPSLEIDSMAATTLLGNMRKAHDGKAALRLHAKIIKSGRLLDAKAYGLMLATLFESGCYSSAIGLFGWLLWKKVQPEKIFFNVVIHQVGNAEGGYEDAERLFKGMRRRGAMADEFTYTTMVQICARKGRMGRAFRLVSEMQDLGLSMTSTFAWTALIDGCGRTGMWERGLDVLKMMRRESRSPSSLVPQPSTSCYNAALYTAGIHGDDWPTALEIFQALLMDEAAVPNIVTYSSMASIILMHRFEVREIAVVADVLEAIKEILREANRNNGRWNGQILDKTTSRKLQVKARRLDWIVKYRGEYMKDAKRN